MMPKTQRPEGVCRTATRLLWNGSSSVLEKARGQAVNAAAIAAAIVLLTSGASAQFGSGPSISEMLSIPELLADARRCNAEAIDTLEQLLNNGESANQRTTRRARRAAKDGEAPPPPLRSESEISLTLVQQFKDKCFPSGDARHIWFEAPNTIANAVWEDALFAIFTEIRQREADLEMLARFQWAFEEALRRAAARGIQVQLDHPYVQTIRELTAKVAQPLAIQQRMLAARLTPDEFDALAQFALEALETYTRNRRELHREIVCERWDAFESPAARGRAIDEVEAIMRAETVQTVATLFEAIGIEASEKVANFAMAAAPDMMRWRNREATFALLDDGDPTLTSDFGCQNLEPIPFEGSWPRVPDAPGRR